MGCCFMADLKVRDLDRAAASGPMRLCRVGGLQGESPADAAAQAAAAGVVPLAAARAELPVALAERAAECRDDPPSHPAPALLPVAVPPAAFAAPAPASPAHWQPDALAHPPLADLRGAVRAEGPADHAPSALRWPPPPCDR